MEDLLTQVCMDKLLKSYPNDTYVSMTAYPEPKPENLVFIYVLMSLDGDNYEPKGYVEGVYTNLAKAMTRAETFIDSDKTNYLIEVYNLETGKEIKQYAFKRHWVEVNW